MKDAPLTDRIAAVKLPPGRRNPIEALHDPAISLRAKAERACQHRQYAEILRNRIEAAHVVQGAMSEHKMRKAIHTLAAEKRFQHQIRAGHIAAVN